MRCKTARVSISLSLLLAGFYLQAVDARAASVKLSRFAIVRTTSGPSWYEISIGASALQDQPGFVGFVSARSSGNRIQQVSPGTTASLYTTDPYEIGAAGQRTSLCKRSNHVLQLCWGREGGPAPVAGLAFIIADYQSGASSRGDDNIVFVVAKGVSAGYTFRGRGWKIVQLPLSFRTVDAATSSALWANAFILKADLHMKAKAWGGRFGSIAVANPPCSYVGIGTGVGTMSLAGGVEELAGTCPLIDAPSLTGRATRSTTWMFAGFVVGSSSAGMTRLFVVDLPKTLPRAAP